MGGITPAPAAGVKYQLFAWTFVVNAGAANISAASNPAITAALFEYLGAGQWQWNLSGLASVGGFGASISAIDNGPGSPFLPGCLMLGSGVIEVTNSAWNAGVWTRSDGGDFSMLAILI